MCLGIWKPEAMAINAFFLAWNNNDFYMFTFQSCRLNISDELQRQGKCSDSCTRISQPILVPAVATDDQPGTLVFLAGTKKFDIATEHLQVPCAIKKKKKKKTVVNSSQSNYTTENYLHILSIIIIYIKQSVSYSENICHLLGYDVLDHVYISHVLDFLSVMFDEGYVTLTAQFTVQYVQ